MKSDTIDRGTYFRLKVKLKYKGQPADFDIVVGCNVRRVGYKDGGSTREVGLTPTVFGRRTDDGKTIVVRTPDACRGDTTNNGAAWPDLLPLIVVYDDAKYLDFGVAYLSEDAYENPLSELSFGGASIEAADRKAFDSFRDSNPNVISERMYVQSDAALPDQYPMLALTCDTYARLKIPQGLRERVSRDWPAERPQYWTAADRKQDWSLYLALKDYASGVDPHVWSSDTPSAELRIFGELGPLNNQGDQAGFGMPTRSGGGLVAPTTWKQRQFSPSYYPALDGMFSRAWPSSTVEAGKMIERGEGPPLLAIDYRAGQTRGFRYCGSWMRVPGKNDLILRRLGPVTVDGGVSAGSKFLDRLVFERDEFVLVHHKFSLESTGGGV